MSHIFGPVPSRRLGYSLGVDIVPYKVCTLDCVYCQVGRTTVKTLKRKEWISQELILENLEKAVSKDEKIDYITFSGSGEPTLNSSIGNIIRRIKDIYRIPVAVLTNSTLLYLPEVRNDLMEADLVAPSLDAVATDVFNMLNRPHHDLNVEKIGEGIKSFRKDFRGRIWLEVMIVKGINDSPEELKRIEKMIRDLGADKIQINSVIRPAAEQGIETADREILEFAKNFFGEKAEIIGEFQKERFGSAQDNIQETIIQLIKRRPCPVKEICKSLGLHEAVVVKHIGMMLNEGRIKEVIHKDGKFYKAF